MRNIGCYECQQLTSGDCGKHGAVTEYYSRSPRECWRCPVCEGRGYVPNGFYQSYAGCPWTTSDLTSETCKACEGKGYVVQ